MVLINLDHVSLTAWSQIMTDVLKIDLPWLTLRAKLVKEDEQGILYNTMFEDYTVNAAKLQSVMNLFK